MPRTIAYSRYEDFYVPGVALARLALDSYNTLTLLVRRGLLHPQYAPHARTALYRKEEIDSLAAQRLAQLVPSAHQLHFRVASGEPDARGIVLINQALEWSAPQVQQRLSWWERNPEMEYVLVADTLAVKQSYRQKVKGTAQESTPEGKRELVLGYLNMAHYTEEALEARLSGQRGSADIMAQDILPLLPGEVVPYDLFVGIAEHPHILQRAHGGSKLLLGAREVLYRWASRGIIVRRLCACSAEPDGIRAALALGFIKQPALAGDYYGRYVLDLSTDAVPFAVAYRAHLASLEQKGERSNLSPPI